MRRCYLASDRSKDCSTKFLLYYPQKKLETQSVLTGEAVPVLGKGIVTLDKASAIDGDVAPGDYLQLSANAGKVTGIADAAAWGIGQLLLLDSA